MRAHYGSARLTKDIDFDCESSVSAASMKANMPKALEHAARATGLVNPACHRPAYRSQDEIGILEPADDRRIEATA